MAADLYHGSPEDHLMLPLPDLWEAVRAIEQWTERHAHVLDYIHQERLRRALFQQPADEELAALHDHISRVASWASRRPELEPHWAGRWQGYADILDRHMGFRQEDSGADREVVLKRLHVSEILQQLRLRRDQGLGQRELRELVGLKPANLTRVLNLMERHELVRRESHGRENRLFIGRLAPEAPPKAPKAPRDAAQKGERRGIEVLAA